MVSCESIISTRIGKHQAEILQSDLPVWNNCRSFVIRVLCQLTRLSGMYAQSIQRDIIHYNFSLSTGAVMD